MSVKYECRGWPAAPPKKGRGKGAWGAGFTAKWGPWANRATKSR